MNCVSQSFQEDEDAWLTLKIAPPLPSLSSPQRPSELPLPPLPPVSAPSPPIQDVPLAAPNHPFSSPHQERYSSVPLYPLTFPVYEPQEPELLPKCDFSSEENQEVQETDSFTRQKRARRLPVRNTKQRKSDTITPPFPWATSKRAIVYSLEHLLTHDIRIISGTVRCKKCEQQHDIEFDLQEKFYQVAQMIAENKYDMHDRALSAWTNPVLPNCEKCGKENSLRPVITKKRTINWLFLLLGQMLGCCTLSHLKYFCKHTNNHRTGAKDRLLYLTYMGLCKQLRPEGPYGV